MYFHNVATHCHPRVPSVAKPCWVPFSLHGYFPEAPTPGRDHHYLELYFGSEPLPRPSKTRSGPVHLQLPSGATDDSANYVLSWPPVLSATPANESASVSPHTASAFSAASDSSFATRSEYYTPPTSPASLILSAVSTPDHHSAFLDLDEDRAEVLSPISRRREPRAKGWARLRASAPPALPLKTDVVSDGSYILESDDEDSEGLVMSAWGDL
ncbi:hypothetical protein B0H14DRAFT_124770 [Mycena olivaceomarginata]|nr:hypothetical protein B0H14DRAFT_124770 [Mycena olivaceomarginata]